MESTMSGNNLAWKFRAHLFEGTIALRDEETLRDYEKALRLAAKAAVTSMPGGADYKCYVEDTDGDTVILNVWTYERSPAIDTYVQFDLSRNADGTFVFSNPQEVMRVSVFRDAVGNERQLIIGESTAPSVTPHLEGMAALKLGEEDASILDENASSVRAKMRAQRERELGVTFGEDYRISGMVCRSGDGKSVLAAATAFVDDYAATGQITTEAAVASLRQSDVYKSQISSLIEMASKTADMGTSRTNRSMARQALEFLGGPI